MDKDRRKVLIVEDEKQISDIIAFNLKREGYEIEAAYDGADGLRMAVQSNPDLVLLDVMLPEMNGFDVCEEVRKAGSSVPIIMLTAREEENDKVLGLDIGADDYMTKPFSMKELLARIKANIRRRHGYRGHRAASAGDGFEVDASAREIYRGGRPLELTQREYELLKFLIEHPGRVFSREELMGQVWNYDYYGDLRTVDVTVRRLREKIEDSPAEPKYILTKRGSGYYFPNKG